MLKKRNRLVIDKVDPKFIRLNIDRLADWEERSEKVAHEVIDGIYSEYRHAVDREINDVDDLFLHDLAREEKLAGEIELSNLLFEKDQAEKRFTK